MHREDLFVDDRGYRQAIEAIRKSLPELDVVATLALIVEAVDAVDRGAFMVAAQNEEVLRVFDLVREEQADCLEGLLPAVYVIPEEEVVRFRWEAAVLEQAEEVIVLAVDIAADLPSSCQQSSRSYARTW